MTYDARGRLTSITKQIAQPGAPNAAIPLRYGSTNYVINFGYDDSNDVTSQSLGATVAALEAPTENAATIIGPSTLTATYTPRGFVSSVGGSYGPLITSTSHAIDGRSLTVKYGDYAGTTTTLTYDNRLRMSQMNISRAAGSFPPASGGYTPPASTAAQNTLQTILLDDAVAASTSASAATGYDNVGNPVTVSDGRIASEWPAGAKPVTTKQFGYDDTYRLLKATTTAGGDTFVPPVAASNVGASAMPLVAPPNRVGLQQFTYNGLGDLLSSTDDSGTFFDRSIGTVTPGSASHGPNQVVSAVLNTATNGEGSLTSTYDAAGNVVQLAIFRNGTCDSATGCNELIQYDWDEVGHLARARRFDFVSGSRHCIPSGLCILNPTPASYPYPSLPAGSANADVSYSYDAKGQRVLRASPPPPGATGVADAGAGTDAGTSEQSVFSVEIFPSLRLDGTTWNGSAYAANATTESVYLTIGALALGRVVDAPSSPTFYESGGSILAAAAYQHVLLEMGDRLTSTSVVIDKASSELVERATYTAYGALDSDYRPSRWDTFTENYKFTGKEQDVEFGMSYFGARYYSPQLGRWLSPDPVAVHSPSSDASPYAYVSGAPTRFIDPLGLQQQDSPGSGPSEDPMPVCIGVCVDPGGTGGPGGSPQDGGSPPPKGTPLPTGATLVHLYLGPQQAAAIAATLLKGLPPPGWRPYVHMTDQQLRDTQDEMEEQELEKDEEAAENAAQDGQRAVDNIHMVLLAAVGGELLSWLGWSERAASAVATTGAGGAGPVLQGQAGVRAAIADIEAAGGRILGREITVDAAGVRTRPDLFVGLPNGQQVFVEVKTGASAAMTTNQTIAFPELWANGGIPRGANAAAAGLAPGVPIGPTPVWTVYYPWPLP